MMTIALAMVAQAAAGTAATPAKAQTPTAKVECRMIADPGSRIPNRVCRLDKEWEALSKDAQDDIRSSRNSRTVAPNGS